MISLVNAWLMFFYVTIFWEIFLIKKKCWGVFDQEEFFWCKTILFVFEYVEPI